MIAQLRYSTKWSKKNAGQSVHTDEVGSQEGAEVKRGSLSV